MNRTQKIKVIKVESVEQPGKTGSYKMLEVTYTNLSYQNKLESKKLPSFKNPEVFNTLAKAVDGDVFDVDQVKDGQYWQWERIRKSREDAETTQAADSGFPTGATKAVSSPKSTYETNEERAKKQVYIIRQSSISNAISTLGIGAKTAPDVKAVIALARDYEKYVLGTDPMSALLNMPDDIPAEVSLDV